MENPKLFISYCWTNSDHETWVLNLAKELTENGVSVILDKWDLKEGHDAVKFMEKMVSDDTINKVLIISDRQYVVKANDRTGGVGTESQIISSKIYENTNQIKFVVVTTEYDEEGKPCLPIYYKSRKYIDFSTEEFYAQNFDQLLRWIYDKPLHVKPELGKMPSFLSNLPSITLGTTSAYKRAIDFIKNSKETSRGALLEYFNIFVDNFERFRINNIEEFYDESLITNIESFIPYRNELIDIFSTIAIYKNSPELIHSVHKLFEKLIPYMDRPDNITHDHTYDYDNFRFLVHELFLYCITSFIKNDCFESASYLINTKYYFSKNPERGKEALVTFSIFRDFLDSLITRNKRLNLRRFSLHADLLYNRCTGGRYHFDDIMQSDFILYLIDNLNTLKNISQSRWYPVTLVYKSRFYGACEIFARAQSKSYFDKIKCMFEIDNHKEFEVLIKAFKEGTIQPPYWEDIYINPALLMNFDKLCIAK